MQNPNRPLARGILRAGLVPILATLASAQIDVAICGAASTSSTDCRFTSVQALLQNSGQFGLVDIINVTTTGTGTPTLAQLQQYDALICWTNNTPADTNAWGDVLADYVDQGGGVVVTVYANSSTTVNRWIGGRWQQGYEVILDQTGTTSTAASLGTVLDPNHPVMSGVTAFGGCTTCSRPTGTGLEVGATLIAQWSDGRVLVAEGANPRRIDLGFYPPPNTCYSTSWSYGGDQLMVNALKHVATAGNCTGSIANYCTPSTTTNACNPTMSASGSPSAAATSGFTLSCGSLEGQQNGLLFYGISGPFAGAWGSGGTSYLCVKAPLERTPVQGSGGNLGACDGAMSVDFLAFLAANPGVQGTPPTAGQQFWAQCWFRDPPAVKTTNLSDGLTFVLCP